MLSLVVVRKLLPFVLNLCCGNKWNLFSQLDKSSCWHWDPEIFCFPSFFVLFLCFTLFFGLFINPSNFQTELRLLCWEGCKPPRSDHTGAETQPTCKPTTAVQTTTESGRIKSHVTASGRIKSHVVALQNLNCRHANSEYLK